MTDKVNCPYCLKKKSHTHKGCNEDGTATIVIGSLEEIEKRKGWKKRRK